MTELFWLTGLSGAGKTTIGKELLALLKKEKPNTVLVDGDNVRDILGARTENCYTPETRLNLAMTYSRLCRMLINQDINVVCVTISLFPECWAWNRENIPHYHEIYIRCPMEILFERDPKGLYNRALKGERSNVMGVDIPLTEPDAHLVVDNKGDVRPIELARRILDFFAS